MRMSRSNEDGIALMFAIVAMVIAAIVVTAIVAASMSTRDTARDTRDQSIAAGPADDGIRAYAAALSAGWVGDHTAYQMTRAALIATVREERPGAGMCTGPGDELCVVANSATPYSRVDTGLVPAAADRLAVRRRVAAGSYRYWQVLAVSPPRFGATDRFGLVSPGGAVVVFVRAWHGDATTSDRRNRPVVRRAVLRPPAFSDFQLAADGQMYLGDGTTINGRVHSNGYEQSLDDQYRSLSPNIITTASGVTCSRSARFITVTGPIDTSRSASCSGSQHNYQRQGELLSLLRVDRTVEAVAALCPRSAPVRIVCITSPRAFAGPYDVRLSGTTVTVSGRGSWSARNDRLGFRSSGGATGLVLLLDRSANVRGSLGPLGRATIMVSNRASIPLPEVPSIHLRRGGTQGASSAATSALGLVAEGDVIAHEGTACPVRLRASLIAQGGMLTRDPQYRGGAGLLPGAPLCGPGFELVGSSVGHLFHYLATGTTAGVVSGYASRTFSWDPTLFDNPPPMFPTTGDWQVLENRPADLACFDPSTATPTLLDRPGCR